MGGCTTVVGPLFPPRERELVWPPPPDPPRIRFVGTFATTKDLNVKRESFLGLADFILGDEKPEELTGPRSVALAPGGRWLWVADPGRRALHRFDLELREYARIERAGGAPLQTPVWVSPGPEGRMLVCDSRARAILRFDAASGEALDPLPLPPSLKRPVAAAWDPETREIFIVDAVSHDLKVLTEEGVLKRVIGRRGTEPGCFNYPCALALGADTLWVADAGNHRIQGLSLEGRPRVSFGSAGDAPGYLALPKGIATDSRGHVYVVDARFENVQIFAPDGRLLLVFGEEGRGDGQFWLPSGIFIDESDRIWVCDSYNRRLQVFQYLDVGSEPQNGEGEE